jgi:hypothetical protein
MTPRRYVSCHTRELLSRNDCFPDKERNKEELRLRNQASLHVILAD